MVVVLDKNAIVFTRIWCGFEQATVVQGKKLLLDFATVHKGKAQLLTDGLATPQEYEYGFRKAARERNFPLNLMEKGYDIDITKANASIPEDKQRILESIEKSAPDPARAVNRVNTALRSMLAEHALRHSLLAWRTPGYCATKLLGQQQRAIEVICSDEERKKVRFDFRRCREMSDVSALAALAGLQKLEELELVFYYCPALSDVSALKALESLQKLKTFVLQLRAN